LILYATFGSSLGLIPVELTRLRKLEDVNMANEPLLEGFVREIFFISFLFSLEKLGEFPLIEGCFQNLRICYLSLNNTPPMISS